MSWGIHNFENDEALEFVHALINGNSNVLKEFILVFVEQFHSEDTSLGDCSKFLAACETVASLIGNPPDELPIELDDWAQKQYTQLDGKIFLTCIDGLEMILKDSEIRELHADSGYLKSWIKIQEDLIKRLSV